MKFLKLFSSSRIVDGVLNSVIIDLQRGIYIVIPKSLSFIVKKLDIQSIEDIRCEIEIESLIHFDSYIDLIISNELGFLTDDPSCFVAFNNQKNQNSKFNLILEDYNILLNRKDIISQLQSIGVSAIHISINKKISITILEQLLEKLMIADISYVSISSYFNSDINDYDLKVLTNKYPILASVYLYSSPNTNQINYDELKIIHNSSDFFSIKNCGTILPKFFTCNFSLFSESLNNNSCLYKKISVDEDGYISNCPSMPQYFGNIKETTLEEALHHSDFKKYWNVTKDNIAICKDCEFRYICTDCRAYTERTCFENDLDLSKPLKCGYNPYTGEWLEWSTNPLKQKAIKYYDMEEFVKNDA